MNVLNKPTQHLARVVNRDLAFEARITSYGEKFKITFFDELIGSDSPFDIVHSSFEEAILAALNAPCLKGKAVLVLPEAMDLETVRPSRT
jgi:hypothetical protein